MTENLPIIIIPGLGTSPRTYSDILPALWSHSSVTIVNTAEHDSIEAIAEHILASVSPPRFNLIGHSMGGYIAFEILRQAPARVAKLALINTSARPDNDEAKEKRKGQIAKAKKGEFAEIIKGALPAFVHPDQKDNEKLQEAITAAHNDAGAEAYINQQTAIMGRKDSRTDLRHIEIPTIVITGDEDKLIPLEPSQEIANSIPNAKLVIIKQAGHMSPLEQPQAVSDALVEWLEG